MPDSLRLSVAPAHDECDDSGTFVRVGRAKQLARPAVPNLFDRACAVSGASNRQIATMLGVNESSVRKMRDGRLAPKPEHWEALPSKGKQYVSDALKPEVDPFHGKVISLLSEAVEMLRARRGT